MVLAIFYLATLTVAVAILVSYVGSLRLLSVFYGLTDNTKEFQKAMETRYKTSKSSSKRVVFKEQFLPSCPDLI